MNHPSAVSDDELARRAGLPPGSRLREARLANGLTVAAAEVPDARWQRLVGAAGVGYLDEPDDCRGLAHLLEHVLFLGSTGFPGAGELARWVGERGGRYNARTDESITEVHLHLPPVDTDEGLARLVDMLARPRFEPGLVAHEVAVLEAEFRARLADPALHRLAALGQLCREGHPARHCHAGNRTTLGTDASRLAARLADFHVHHYRAGGMALVMLGPLPLEVQLELLTRHGTALPAGDAPSPPRAWRWAQPGGVAWHSPTSRTSATSLELFWPLPDEQATAHANRLAAVAARLADGHLAATLQAAMELDRLEVTLEPVGLGSALALNLAPAPDEETVQAMLATCCAAFEQAIVATLPAPSVPAADLDAWPRRYARQLAGSVKRAPCDAISEETAPLPWLTSEQYRLLWHAPAASGRWKTLTETGTRWRPQPLPEEQAPLPWRCPPALSLRPRPDTSESTPRQLCQSARLTLWSGEPVRLADAPAASLCLGWPAPAAQQGARLFRWRQNTLPLRQAALAQGLQLSCAGDARGDWLIVSGAAERLCSLAELALARWPEQAAQHPCDPPVGLLAQRLLTLLETSTLRVARAGALPVLGWVSGGEDADAAQAMLSHLAGRLSAGPPMAAGATPHEASEENDDTRWLPPQGDDHVAMLEVAGPDDTPCSRWLLRLLAQCHDAAFQHEMRQRRGLGYVAAVRYREASGTPRLGYVVQSPHAGIGELRQAIADFLTQQGEALAHLTAAEMERRKRSLLAHAGHPETQAEAIAQLWQALRRHAAMKNASPPWQPLPWEAESQALAALHVDSLLDLAKDLAAGRLVQRWWLHQPR